MAETFIQRRTKLNKLVVLVNQLVTANSRIIEIDNNMSSAGFNSTEINTTLAGMFLDDFGPPNDTGGSLAICDGNKIADRIVNQLRGSLSGATSDLPETILYVTNAISIGGSSTADTGMTRVDKLNRLVTYVNQIIAINAAVGVVDKRMSDSGYSATEIANTLDKMFKNTCGPPTVSGSNINVCVNDTVADRIVNLLRGASDPSIPETIDYDTISAYTT